MTSRRVSRAGLLAVLALAVGCRTVEEVQFVGDASMGAPADARTEAGSEAAVTPAADAGDGFALGMMPGNECKPEGAMKYPIMENSIANNMSPAMYNSNPPSSGSHCTQQGAYGAYSQMQPLPRCNWIRNLALGGVVVVYNCPDGCASLLQEVGRAVMGLVDPDCATGKRLIITPDPALDVKLAAAAWGYTWRSNCLDAGSRDSLVKFLNEHIGSKGDAPDKQMLICK
jgi:hypothetical protein